MASRDMVSRRKESTAGENFKVAVRVRPPIQRERVNRAPPQCCVTVDEESNSVSITKPASRKKSTQIGIDDFGELVRTDTNHTHNFYYDIIFSPESIQQEIFSECVLDIVESVLDGYNGSIIASGQTGSGKTHTIEGELGEEKGVIPRAAEMVFQYIESFPNKTDRFLVRVSFLEIYNEKISDLMCSNRDNLKIREDGVGGVFVDGLSEHVVRNTDGIMSLLRTGARLRTTGSTKMNEKSSRSHAVFTIIVEHATYDGTGGNVITIGKLRLVDLAGSERWDMDAQSRQQEETKSINVSLHTFGKVVTALTTPGAKHIPYRDSRLTRILQDSLGGNCKTTLIATITPLATAYNESMNTLKFAKRAKSIKNTASINKDMSQKALLSAYQTEIKKLKEELLKKDGDGGGGSGGKEEIEKLEKGMIVAQKEKDEVLSQLKAHQSIMTKAEQDKEELTRKVMKLENMLLHSGGEINETEEFKKAVEHEQERIRKETESQYESRLAELESEKKRLEDERAEVERQKDYIAKMKAEFQSDDVDGGFERGSSPIKRKPLSAGGNRRIPDLTPKKPSTAPNFPIPPRPSSHGRHTTPLSITNPLQANHRRTVSADYLGPRSRQDGWMPQGDHAPSVRAQLDDVTTAALREYAQALAHPQTGIPSQTLTSGVRIFTGSDCVKWFRQNMVGITAVQQTQDVGQRLMDLGVFMEINGMTDFVVSDQVYYQFSELSQSFQNNMSSSSRLNSAQSLQFPPQGSGISHSRRSSIHSINDGTPPHYAQSLASASTHSGWDTSSLSLDPSSSSMLDQSFDSLKLEEPQDLLEHYQLNALSPTELHVSALYGDRTKIKSLVRELSVDCLDTAGHTPLMYAVMGRQSKSCQQLLRLNANINLRNQYGQTPLFLAATLEFHDILRTLLKNGAQTDLVDENGQTVFHSAARAKNTKCIDYLTRYSSDLQGLNVRDHHYHTPLHSAVMANSPDNITHLLSAKADLGVSDQEGRTALHYTVKNHAPLCAQAIAQAVPNDINLVDKECGWAALHLACSANAEEIVSVLTSYPSCDLNLKDKSGSTPLHLGVHGNCLNIVSRLLSKGASTNIKDNGGKTALQLSLHLGYNQCSRLISTRANS